MTIVKKEWLGWWNMRDNVEGIISLNGWRVSSNGWDINQFNDYYYI